MHAWDWEFSESRNEDGGDSAVTIQHAQPIDWCRHYMERDICEQTDLVYFSSNA